MGWALLLGMAVGMVAAGLVAATVVLRRARLVDSLGVRLRGPQVPDNVLEAVRAAEVRWYADLPRWRRAVKDVQDVAATMWPGVVFRLDSSIGAYRIKAKTIHGLVGYAVERGYLRLAAVPHKRYNKVLPFFALQPTLNDWQACVLLQWLRERHPHLGGRPWQDIAADPEAIAKLYSGYMGAGGDWAAWESSPIPGDVARARLGFDGRTGEYAHIGAPR